MIITQSPLSGNATLGDVSSMQATIAEWFDTTCKDAWRVPKRRSVAYVQKVEHAINDLAEYIGKMEALMDQTKVTSDEGREIMAKIAERGYDFARRLDNLIERAPNPQLKSKIEDLFFRMEDIAETAELVSSKEFEHLLNLEIKRFFDGQAKG